MKIYFNYNRPSVVQQIMSGIFYDADLDTSLTNQEITESLSLTTTAPSSTTGLDYIIKMVTGSEFTTPFDINNPITGITSNSQSVNIKLVYEDLLETSGHYFTKETTTETGDPCTYEQKTFSIKANDGELESDALSIDVYAINQLPTFDVDFLNADSEPISSINISSVGDSFIILISNVSDAEDKVNYLSEVAFADLYKYVKLVRTYVEGMGDADDINIPGFTLSEYYNTTNNQLRLTYTCSSLLDAFNGGGQNIRVALYDSMGVFEQEAVSDMSLHKNRTIGDKVLTLAIDSVEVTIEPVTTAITIDGETYQPVGKDDNFVESTTDTFINIPFEITTTDPQKFSLSAVLESSAYEMLQDGVGVKAILCSQADTDTVQTQDLDLSDIIYTYYADIVSNALYGVLRLPVKAKWWGDVVLTIYAGVGPDATLGSSSFQWKLGIAPVNNAPKLLV